MKWICTASLVVVMTTVAAAQRKEPSQQPIIRMDDGFEYALLDFGVGAIPASISQRRNETRVLWVKVRLTNTVRDRLLTPRFWTFPFVPAFPPMDEHGNRYPVRAFTVAAPSASSGRYKPGESSIELLTIPADELLETIKEIRIGLGESGGVWSLYRFFALEQPLTRVRDLDPDRPDPDSADLPAKARRAMLPPTPRP